MKRAINFFHNENKILSSYDEIFFKKVEKTWLKIENQNVYKGTEDPTNDILPDSKDGDYYIQYGEYGNYLKFSEDFSSSGWTNKNNKLSKDYYIKFPQDSYSTKIIPSEEFGEHSISTSWNNEVKDNFWCLSFYVLPDELKYFQLIISDANETFGVKGDFSITLNSMKRYVVDTNISKIGDSENIILGQIGYEKNYDGSYRVYVSAKFNMTCPLYGKLKLLRNINGNIVDEFVNINNTAGLFINSAQLNKGQTPTKYMPSSKETFIYFVFKQLWSKSEDNWEELSEFNSIWYGNDEPLKNLGEIGDLYFIEPFIKLGSCVRFGKNLLYKAWNTEELMGGTNYYTESSEPNIGDNIYYINNDNLEIAGTVIEYKPSEDNRPSGLNVNWKEGYPIINNENENNDNIENESSNENNENENNDNIENESSNENNEDNINDLIINLINDEMHKLENIENRNISYKTLVFPKKIKFTMEIYMYDPSYYPYQYTTPESCPFIVDNDGKNIIDFYYDNSSDTGLYMCMRYLFDCFGYNVNTDSHYFYNPGLGHYYRFWSYIGQWEFLNGGHTNNLGRKITFEITIENNDGNIEYVINCYDKNGNQYPRYDIDVLYDGQEYSGIYRKLSEYCYNGFNIQNTFGKLTTWNGNSRIEWHIDPETIEYELIEIQVPYEVKGQEETPTDPDPETPSQTDDPIVPTPTDDPIVPTPKEEYDLYRNPNSDKRIILNEGIIYWNEDENTYSYISANKEKRNLKFDNSLYDSRMFIDAISFSTNLFNQTYSSRYSSSFGQKQLGYNSGGHYSCWDYNSLRKYY